MRSREFSWPRFLLCNRRMTKPSIVIMKSIRMAAVLLTALILVGCGAEQAEETAADRQDLVAELAKEKRLRAVYEEANQDLARMLEEAKAEARGDLASWQEDSLRKRGLENPMSDLRQSLKEQTQFLPPKSDKGLAYFFESETARFLDPNYTWVTITEGHYGGKMLLRYEVKDGTIAWSKLWSAMD